jgi:hypothetical protein
MLEINSKDVREFAKRVRMLSKRYGAAVEPVLAAEASRMRRDVLARAPDIEGYRKSLVVVAVKGKPQGWTRVGVVGMPRKIRMRDEAPGQNRMVLYVMPTKFGERVQWVMSMSGVIWTPDTLPAEPPRKMASIVARRVSQREFDWAAAESAAKRPAMVDMLNALKIPVLVSKAEIRRRVELDMGFEVLRAEFGLGGVPGQAHWRPAIKKAVKRFRGVGFARMTDWLASSTGMRYAPRGSVVRRRVSPKLAASVSGFQSRIKP